MSHSLSRVSPPLIVGAGYYLSAILGQWLAFPAAPVSALWAPNAILLAGLLLAPRARWWEYLIAIAPFHLLAQLPGYPLPQVVIQYFANVSEALLGALAMDLLCKGQRTSDKVRTIFVLIVFGALLAPLLTSIAMAAAFALFAIPADFVLTVTVRTLTNSFAVVALVPVIVHSVERLRSERQEVSFARATEAISIALVLIAVCTVVFVLPAAGQVPPALLYAPVPALVWAAFRFGVPGACCASLLVGAVSTWGVLHGRGPFAAEHSIQNAISVVCFHVVTSITLVFFAALLGEWRRSGRALAASESRFRTIFEHNIIPTLIWRDAFRVRDANDSFLRLAGFTRRDVESGRLRVEDFTGWNWEDATPRWRSLTDLEDHSDGREKDLRLRGGRRVPVVLGHSRFANENGGVIYALDLSEFRRSEAQRRRAESLHSAVLTSLQDEIAIVDREGVVIEVNESWRRGIEHAPASRFDRVLAGDNLVAACAQAAASGSPNASEQLEALRLVLDGLETRQILESESSPSEEPCWIEVSIELLRRPEGGAIITRRDVTARKLAEIDARNQRQQLTHLGRAAVLGQLSGAFAHELNQPLTSILGNAEAGLRIMQRRDTDVSGELKDILHDIVQDNERAAQVIQRLRALLDKGDILRRPIDLNVTVREVLDLCRSELITRNVSVSTDLDPQAPLVMADRVQMQQVIMNLLINACEAMSGMPVAERKITVVTRFHADRGCVEAIVRDSGSGIPAQDLERIFQPFVSTKSHGMGLGLAICRSVVESHHGHLWAESGSGGGAAFHMRVPTEG